MEQPPLIYGAIEAGGTKFVCAAMTAPTRVIAETVIATTTPDETLVNVVHFFESVERAHGPLRSFGIASFGPVQVLRSSPQWGRLLETPKPGWSHATLIEPLQLRWPTCAIELDTDVNAAALAESVLGAGRNAGDIVYITVGTGIGGGAVVNGGPLHGWMHPEMGHIGVRRDPRDRDFAGTCPFHGDCVEGLACGVAIQRRWGVDLSRLGEDHPAFSIIGNYLGQLAATIALVLSPERIVFGGGVIMSNIGLLAHIRRATRDALAGYVHPRDSGLAIEDAICVSALGGRAGLYGAALLAQRSC
jgi:fructokinase